MVSPSCRGGNRHTHKIRPRLRRNKYRRRQRLSLLLRAENRAAERAGNGGKLPPVVVITKTSPGQKPKQVAHKASGGKAASQSKQPLHVGQPSAGGTPATTAAQALAAKSESFNQARANLLTQIGTNSYDFTQQAIQTIPQGSNTPVDRVLLQAPGVTQDSAASGLLHVRNEHANVQYRINGIVLPDGVSGFGQVLQSNFISSISLVTGVLPTEYGPEVRKTTSPISLHGSRRGGKPLADAAMFSSLIGR